MRGEEVPRLPQRLVRAASHSTLEQKSSRFDHVMQYINQLTTTTLDDDDEDEVEIETRHLEEHQLEGLTWALIFELQREQRARKDAEARLEDQKRLALVYKLQLDQQRRIMGSRRVRFEDEGFDDDDDGGLDDSLSDDETASKYSMGTVDEYESAQDHSVRAAATVVPQASEKLVSECVLKTLERHAHGLQAKNDTLQCEICQLEERLDKEIANRLKIEQDQHTCGLLREDDVPPPTPPKDDPDTSPRRHRPPTTTTTCPVCYEPFTLTGERSPRRMACCDAVACHRCLLELADGGELCCPECFTTSPVDSAYDDGVSDDVLNIVRTALSSSPVNRASETET